MNVTTSKIPKESKIPVSNKGSVSIIFRVLAKGKCFHMKSLICALTVLPCMLFLSGVYPSWGSDGIAAEMRYAFGVIRHVLQKRSLPDAMPDGQHTSG